MKKGRQSILFHDLGFAKPEPHRIHRQGFPEAIYCPGKTIPQILSIFKSLSEGPGPVLATRATALVAKRIRKAFPKAIYHPEARLVVYKPLPFTLSRPPLSRWRTPAKAVVAGGRGSKGEGVILVITGGTADLPVAEEAAVTAEALGRNVERLYDVGVAGLHRLTAHRQRLQQAKAIIVCAGMEGALASVVGGLVGCPVIAVPTSIGYGAHFKGVAPLLTMLNSCASNVCVVNIDNGFSAGVIASLIAMRRFREL